MSADKFKVFVSRNDFGDDVISLLQQKCAVRMWSSPGVIPRDQLLKAVQGCDGLLIAVPDPIDVEMLNKAGPQLKAVSTSSVGFDHIDIVECRKRGIAVGHTPNILSNTMAETTIGLLLTTCRRLSEASAAVKAGHWISSIMPTGWMFGVDVFGSTVGIVGFGRIGQAVAKRLSSFELGKLLYFDVEEKPEGVSLNAHFTPFEELLRSSDFIICCCALTVNTRELFNRKAFSLMKKGAVFINTSRGGVVEQDALYNALLQGHIRGAGLDTCVPEPIPASHPLTKLDNCIITPHMGTATFGCRNAMAIMAVNNLLCGMEGTKMPAQVL